MKRYSEEHQWVEWDGDTAEVGLTAHAAEELGELSFVELPEVGAVFAQGDAMCVVESVKAASDVMAPVGGTVSEVNGRLEENPALANDSPEKDGWICRLREVDEQDLDSLMTEPAYEQYLAADDGDD